MCVCKQSEKITYGKEDQLVELSWKKDTQWILFDWLLMIWNVLPINSSFSLMEIITLRVWQLTVNITYYFSTKSNTYTMEKSIAVNKPVFIPLSADILSSYRHLLSYWFMPRLHWIEISMTRRPLQRGYTASQWCIRHIAATKCADFRTRLAMRVQCVRIAFKAIA